MKFRRKIYQRPARKRNHGINKGIEKATEKREHASFVHRKTVNHEEHKDFSNVESKLRQYIMKPSKGTKTPKKQEEFGIEDLKSVFSKLKYSFTDDLDSNKIFCQVVDEASGLDQGTHAKETNEVSHSNLSQYISSLKKKEFAVMLYHREELNLDQSMSDNSDGKENIDEKYEIYPLPDFYKSKVKHSEKQDTPSDKGRCGDDHF